MVFSLQKTYLFPKQRKETTMQNYVEKENYFEDHMYQEATEQMIIENDFGFTYKGPGIYKLLKHTLLILESERNIMDIKLYDVFIWEKPWEQTYLVKLIKILENIKVYVIE